MSEKYTKKATARIISEVLKIDPKASKLTSFDQAFVKLMTYWDMELGIITKINQPTIVTLYRDEETPYEWKFEDAWVEKEGDYDWNTIYKTVLEDIIKLKLYKRPKLGKRAQKKRTEEITKKKKVEVEEVKTETTKPTLEELRKQRDNLSAKISQWKRNKKDPKTLETFEKQLEDLRKQIKEYK